MASSKDNIVFEKYTTPANPGIPHPRPRHRVKCALRYGRYAPWGLAQPCFLSRRLLTQPPRQTLRDT